MVSKVRLSSSHIDEHLRQQADSGLSVVAYCELHSLKVANFHNWRSTRRRQVDENPNPWVEVTPTLSASTLSVPQGKSSAQEHCGAVLVELLLPGGIVLRVSPAVGELA